MLLSVYLSFWSVVDMCEVYYFLHACSVRSLVCLNLYNYGSGRHPWGDLKPDYLEKVLFLFAGVGVI